MAVEWLKIRNDYVSGGGSYRKLAKKYGVSESSIYARGKAEEWVRLKKEVQSKTAAKTLQKIAESESKKEADRITRLLNLSDQLSDKIEQAISELDICLAKKKTKTKTIEYKDYDAPGKPTREVIDEIEEVLEYKSTVDRLGLQQVATALKAVKDVVQISTDGTGDDNQGDGFMEALNGTAREDWDGDE